MLALVDVLGAERPINLGMLEDAAVAPGEWVLIHMGFALERIDEDQGHRGDGRPGDDGSAAEDREALDG